MCGTLIAMGVSMLIGLANDIIGVYYSFYSIAVCINFSTIILLFIKKVQGKVEQQEFLKSTNHYKETSYFK